MGEERILIIIPAYNEAENIEHVVDDLIKNYSQYDYVVINDGSSDDTRKICARRGYNFLDLPVNAGCDMRTITGMTMLSRLMAMVNMIRNISLQWPS